MMSGPFFRALSVAAFMLFFSGPTGGEPPAPADSLKNQPPQRSDGLSRPELLKRLRQRRMQNREIQKYHAIIEFALERLLVRRSPLDNMPAASPGSGFAFNMPIAKSDPNIDYKLRVLKTPSVPYQREPIPPQSRPFKRK